jgi:GTP-binding protein
MTLRRPVVALVGRPNVGKSTLFNRLVGKRLALVHDRPGVTRDRHYAKAEMLDRRYTLVDTGGYDPSGDDSMKQNIARQIDAALAEADIVVCVLDATLAPSAADSDEMRLLRGSDKPVIYAANKADSDNKAHVGHDLYRLGMDHIIFMSALHGRGVDVLEDAIYEALGAVAVDEEPEPVSRSIPRVAVIGRPNAGKSSLVNRLLGSERMLVDDRPGTTRDAIDSIVEHRGQTYLFVDTAGLRKKARVASGGDAVEALSASAAVAALERAEVVVLMCDAEAGVAEQDAKILGLAVERGRGAVVALNKIDRLDDDERKAARRVARDVLSFAPWIPVVPLSAKTGRGVSQLLGTVDRVRAAFDQRVSTGELNRFFETVLAGHPPPAQGGRAPRFYYVTQASIRPPTFMVVTSHPDHIHFSYQRYVINAIRKAFGFEGVPIRVHYRRKGRRPTKRR